MIKHGLALAAGYLGTLRLTLSLLIAALAGGVTYAALLSH